MFLLAAASLVCLVSAGGRRARAQDNHVEITGSVANVSGTCPNLVFTVANLRVATHAGTRFDDGTCADVKAGRRVEVEGTVQPDGALRAREVDQRP
ncbi:DUF5666 domain-containing protein [Polyangium sp. 15x6]|uniref:DUF5666 domain-containing protein n=1 Tax=Polyangium sp. 15x6 TaxID=3042687 RepID=UPI00249A858E|nr:DUF5666 domain-containing protein [Polyangium sp. 15x6]MDI3288694.1 DUF5666 domain-containing protein [Polyangium sp. 15x6]